MNFLQHFEVDTDNLEGLSWSPNGSTFAVWESPLEVRKSNQNLNKPF